jgi:ABC-2 type transport system permease protein
MNYIAMNLKRMMKRKVNLLFMLAVPFVLVSFASMIGGSSFDIKISYVDKDKSVTSMMLLSRLEKVGSVHEMAEDEIDMDLIGGDHEVAVIIGKGFEDTILDGLDAAVELKSIQGANVTFPVSAQVMSFISSAETIARTPGSSRELYYKILGDYSKGLSGVDVQTTQNRSMQRVVTRMSIGFLFMNMLFLACQAASVLVDDKKKKIYYRIFSGPVNTFRYMLENIASYYIVMLIQIVIIMAAMFGMYGMYYGASLLNMFILFAVFGALSVSFGVMVNTVTRTPSQAGAMSSLIITPISMLGGLFWDINMMPDFLQKISKFLPTAWGINAAAVLLEGKPLSDILDHILVLLLFTAGFFVIGSLKKADIAR